MSLSSSVFYAVRSALQLFELLFFKFICKQFSMVGQFPEIDVIMATDF